jgi:phosphatidate cytidylyltransferase
MFMSKIAMTYFLIILLIFSFIEFSNMNLIINKNRKVFQFFYNILFLTYIFFITVVFLFATSIDILKINLFVILLTCIASDVGGITFGKLIKGPKLTKISPNKTISGSFGSIIFSCITFYFLIYFFYNQFLFIGILVGLFISVGVQIGDLFFSLLKRKSKLKNTGNILPGHGGLLDRIDGILLGVPVGLIIIIFII